MRLRFLGTGTSFGVPVVGCDCPTCASSDPRDTRTRHSAVLESDDGAHRVLIDAPPDLRSQLLRNDITSIDGVWFTHCHADHVHGIDDLRIFSLRDKAPVRAFADESCARILRKKFDYIFDPSYRPPTGTTKPEIDLAIFQAGETVRIDGFDLTPLPVSHGNGTVYGFRSGDLGYITDAKRLPRATRDALQGVSVLVLNALWSGRPHPTHLTVEEAVEIARELGAKRTYLTHLSHRVRHAELLATLPDDIEPAYDGMVINMPST